MWEYGKEIALRYLDGAERVMAALPMRVVADDGERIVAWLAPGTPISYWALEDGTDPRNVPIEERFDRPLVTRPRTWQGQGVLRVLPLEETYSVVHFWNDDGSFAAWHINLESTKHRHGDLVDTHDYLLDLFVRPDRTYYWKDEDEAAIGVRAGWLRQEHADLARVTGERIIASLDAWPPAHVGNWRDFVADPTWGPVAFKPSWLDVP